MAKFFVNRGGGRVPEGPFEAQQIVRLILAGKLKGGHICEEGLQRFTPLEDHPEFSAALRQVGIVPAPEALEARARPAAGQQRRGSGSSRGMLFGAIVAFFGLAIGGVAIGTYVMFNTGGMPAHAAMPNDTELLFEIGDVRRAVGNLGTARGLDSKQLSLLSDTADALSASFGVAKAQANALILAASSLGVGARKLSSKPEGGVVLTFGSATPVNALFNTKRFTYYGLVSTNGRKYRLKEAPPDAKASDATTRTLSSLALDGQGTVLVWFETSKALFVGSPSFAEDVARALSLDVPSLDTSARFKAAQRGFIGKPDAIAYLDPAQLGASGDPRLSAITSVDWKKAEPIIASLNVVPAGVLAHVSATLSVDPSAAQSSGPTALPLTVVNGLPSETFAYVAAATKTSLSGADLRKLLLQQVAQTAPALVPQIILQLQQVEARFHFDIDRVLGSIGDQSALALLAPADYGIALESPYQAATHFALLHEQALKDEAPVRALFAQLKTELELLPSQVTVREDADGYVFLPKDEALGVSLQVRIIKGFLCSAIGNTSLVERSMRALSSGESTLGADPAHRAARAALPSTAQLLAWVDAGRVVNTVQQNLLWAGRVQSLGLAHPALRWTGPDRITTGIALNQQTQHGVVSYRVDALNLPVFAGFLPMSH